MYHLFVKNIKGDGRGLKKEGAYSLSSPEKEGGLVEDLCYKGNGYKLSAQWFLGLFGWQALHMIG